MDEQTVRSLQDALSEAGELSHAFADYWLSLPRTGLVPSRRDFHPEAVPGLLPYIVIHELIRPDLIRIRLAGTNLAETYGKEITGMNYLDFVEEERRAKASEAIFLVFQQPAGMLVQLDSATEKGEKLHRESIAFPVRDDDGTARFVYFCSTPTEPRHSQDERDELQVMSVMQRTYLDIGAGTPDFED